jgi:hypothetical protein
MTRAKHCPIISCSLRHSLNLNSRTVASSPALKRVATNGTLRRQPRVQVEPAGSILAVPPPTQRLPRPPRWLGLPLPSSPSVFTFHESRSRASSHPCKEGTVFPRSGPGPGEREDGRRRRTWHMLLPAAGRWEAGPKATRPPRDRSVRVGVPRRAAHADEASRRGRGERKASARCSPAAACSFSWWLMSGADLF